MAERPYGPLAKGIAQRDKPTEKTERKVQDAYLEPFCVYAVHLQGQARGKAASVINLFCGDAHCSGSGRQNYHQFEDGVVPHKRVLYRACNGVHRPGQLLGVVIAIGAGCTAFDDAYPVEGDICETYAVGSPEACRKKDGIF